MLTMPTTPSRPSPDRPALTTEPAVLTDGGLGRVGSASTSPTTAPTSPAGRASPSRRTVQGVLEEALATMLRRAGRAHRGRPHRRRRARHRAGRARRPARRRRRTARLVRRLARLLPARRAGPRGHARAARRSTPASPRCGATTATGSPPRRPAPSRCAPGTPSPGRTRSTSTPSTPRPRCCSASTTSRRSASAARAPRPSASCSAFPGRAVPDDVVTAAVSADAFCHSMVRSWSARCSPSEGDSVAWTSLPSCCGGACGPRRCRWHLRTASRWSPWTTRPPPSWPPAPTRRDRCGCFRRVSNRTSPVPARSPRGK